MAGHRGIFIGLLQDNLCASFRHPFSDLPVDGGVTASIQMAA